MMKGRFRRIIGWIELTGVGDVLDDGWGWE